MIDRAAPKFLNLSDSVPEPITHDGARETWAQPLLTAAEGTGALDIRVVRIKPGGVSADHAHAWEQANYVLSGAGTITLAEHVRPISANDFVYVPPRIRHAFANTGGEELVLLSMLGPKS